MSTANWKAPKKAKFATAAEAIAAMAARENKTRPALSDEAFLSACASGQDDILRTDPRYRKIAAQLARRDAGLYREGN